MYCWAPMQCHVMEYRPCKSSVPLSTVALPVYAEYIFITDITDNWSAISAKPLPSPPSSIIVICCRFFDALLAKETRRSQRYRLQLSSFDISKNEFLCPLCETISNTVLPLMPSLQTLNKDRLLLCYGFSVFLLFFINFCCFSLIQCCWQ